jgi:ribosomal protein S18 acetylase RimI-like enzyme
MVGVEQDPYNITRARLRDIRAVRLLERAAFAPIDVYPWLEIFALLTFPSVINLKAVQTANQKLVGFVSGDPRVSQEFSWIVVIAVHPDHQQRGLGRRLLAACEDALPTDRIRLTVRAGNAKAIALYEQTGYCRQTVRHRYYRDGEDGIIMEKNKRENRD